jgi:hypothetical protein
MKCIKFIFDDISFDGKIIIIYLEVFRISLDNIYFNRNLLHWGGRVIF